MSAKRSWVESRQRGGLPAQAPEIYPRCEAGLFSLSWKGKGRGLPRAQSTCPPASRSRPRVVKLLPSGVPHFPPLFPCLVGRQVDSPSFSVLLLVGIERSLSSLRENCPPNPGPTDLLGPHCVLHAFSL